MSILSSLYLVLVFLLGIISLTLLPLKLNKFFRLIIGPALGLVVTTQITLITSLILNLTRSTVLVSLSLFALLTLFIAWKKTYILNCHQLFQDRLQKLLERKRPQSNWRSQLKSGLAHWPLISIGLTIGSLVSYIFLTQVLAPQPYGWVTGSNGLWGDTALHSAYTTSLAEQGMPPQNPLFAGINLVYPFLVNLFSAGLTILGSNLRFAFILPQLGYFLASLNLFYLLAKKFTNNHGVFFALLIFFLGWGLGWREYLMDINTSNSFQIRREYTNNLKDYHLHNPLVGLILPERSFLPGMFITLLITMLFLDQLKTPKNNFLLNKISLILNRLKQFTFPKNKFFKLTTYNLQLITIGLLLGITPLWHTHAFLFLGISIATWYLSLILLSFTRRRESVSPASLFLQLLILITSAFLVSLPVIIWFSQQVSHKSFIHSTQGFMGAKPDFLTFWWNNTGLFLPLAVLGIFKLKQNRWFFLPAIITFIIANFIIFQPWDWDNIKLFTLSFMFLSIPAGHVLALPFAPTAVSSLSQSLQLLKKGSFRLLSLITLTSLIFSGTLSLINQSRATFTIYDLADQDLANWVKVNTSADAVFLIDPQPNHPLPGLTGRSVYLGYPGHLWVHGIKYSEREQRVKQILAGDLSVLNSSAVKIDYLVVYNSANINFKKYQQLNLVFQNNKYQVYKVANYSL